MTEEKDTTPATTTEEKESGVCMLEACGCCYSALDCNNIELGMRMEEDCLCIRHACCLSLSAKSLGFGLTTDENDPDEICKVGLGVCDLGLVKPSTLCAGAGKLCCYYEVVSFPCSENYVNEFVCAFCFLQCAPNPGCCKPPPDCPALNQLCSTEVEALTMDRGDEPAPEPEPEPPKVITGEADTDPDPPPAKAEAKVIEPEDKEVAA